MRRMIALAVLAVGALAGQASANGLGHHGGYGGYYSTPGYYGGGSASKGFGFRLKLFGGIHPGNYGGPGPGAQLGPWYQYWPYEAHFQAPALPQYPYWPAPQTLPSGSAQYPFPG